MTNKQLLALLKQHRNQLAQIRGLPPYRILSNQTLEQLVQEKPAKLQQLKDIHGFGPVKIAQYGSEFIRLINSFETTQSVSSPNQSVDPPFTGNQRNELSNQTTRPPLQNPQGNPYIFTVNEYIQLVNQLLTPTTVIIAGEAGQVDNRSRYTFFALHDVETDAVITCFIWEWQLKQQGVTIKTGDQIQIVGNGKVYAPRGSLSFEVNQVQLKGEGALKQAFEQLKDRLEKEGLFEQRYKQDLPSFPQQIGLITSKHGQALHDFKSHLAELGLQIYHFHSAVEGFNAVDSIVDGIHHLNQYYPDLDVIVITRGGGSAESLQSFNHESIVRAVRSSKIPILTAIGHHQDQSLADLAADFSCSTPTDAAKTLSEAWVHAQHQIRNLNTHLSSQFKNQVTHSNHLLEQQSMRQASQLRQMLSQVHERLRHHTDTHHQFTNYMSTTIEHYFIRIHAFHQLIQQQISFSKQQLSQLHKQLQSSHPHHRLAQGYSIITNQQGKIITQTQQISLEEDIQIRFHRGDATAVIKHKDD